MHVFLMFFHGQRLRRPAELSKTMEACIYASKSKLDQTLLRVSGMKMELAELKAQLKSSCQGQSEAVEELANIMTVCVYSIYNRACLV